MDNKDFVMLLVYNIPIYAYLLGRNPSHIPALTAFYFPYTMKCSQKGSMGLFQSSMLRISQQLISNMISIVFNFSHIFFISVPFPHQGQGCRFRILHFDVLIDCFFIMKNTKLLLKQVFVENIDCYICFCFLTRP